MQPCTSKMTEVNVKMRVVESGIPGPGLPAFLRVAPRATDFQCVDAGDIIMGANFGGPFVTLESDTCRRDEMEDGVVAKSGPADNLNPRGLDQEAHHFQSSPTNLLPM